MTQRFRMPCFPALVLACCLVPALAAARDEGAQVYQKVLKSVV